jgi:hypothetical protein
LPLENYMWLADKIYEYYIEFNVPGHATLRREFKKYYDIDLLGLTLSATYTWQHMVDCFREGWVPTEDPEWLEFKRSFT